MLVLKTLEEVKESLLEVGTEFLEEGVTWKVAGHKEFVPEDYLKNFFLSFITMSRRIHKASLSTIANTHRSTSWQGIYYANSPRAFFAVTGSCL